MPPPCKLSEIFFEGLRHRAAGGGTAPRAVAPARAVALAHAPFLAHVEALGAAHLDILASVPAPARKSRYSWPSSSYR